MMDGRYGEAEILHSMLLMLLQIMKKVRMVMMRMQTHRTKELMLLHGKLKQSEAKYSAIRDLMSGENIFFLNCQQR